MQALLRRWTDLLLEKFGLHAVTEHGWDVWVALLLVLIAVVFIDFLARTFLTRSIRLVVERTRFRWDDELFSKPVLDDACHLLSAVLLYCILPVVFDERSWLHTLFDRLSQCWLVVSVCRLLCALIRSSFRIAVHRPAWQNKPIKGLRQTAQGIVVLIGAVLIVSFLFGKSPAVFLTGLGASAAILLLIFKDSILGFVSGIQLSVNDMLQVGDWIEMPKYGANGTVVEVTLTTVKVRNSDNTIVTVPPYLLVSESFQNWQAMKRSGGRLVMRSVLIDVTSIAFCTSEQLDRFGRMELVGEFVAQQLALHAESRRRNVPKGAAGDGDAAAAVRIPNIEVFRRYLTRYLETRVPVRHDMRLIVRQLEQTETGLPLQLYFFTDTVDSDRYETIQSELFAHLFAVAGEFGLRIFQLPSGRDLS